MTPFVDIANALALPCNSNCCLNRSCTQDLSIRLVLQERTYIYGSVDEPAPKDSEKSKIIKKALNEKFVKDSNGKHHFLINGNCRLCPAAYVRVAGLSKFQDFSKAPGQFLRLFNKHVQGDNELDELSEKKIRLKADEKFTPIRGFQEGFISDIALYFSDTLPTVKNPKGSTETKQLPYKYIKDLYEEMKFQCQTTSPPIPESVYGSLGTFKKTYNKLYRLGKIQLLGGKGGFETCSFCNHCIAMKRSAAAKRDRATIDIIRALQRLHMKQQSIERQHCDNFVYKCKTEYNNISMYFKY